MTRYKFIFDLEFSGPDVVRNQIHSYGIALFDTSRRKVLASTRSGNFHFEDGRDWDESTLDFWLSVSEMVPIADLIDKKNGTISLKEGIDGFVEWIRAREADVLNADNLSPDGMQLFSFMTDTNAIDSSHMNASLAKFGYPSLVKFFDNASPLKSPASDNEKYYMDVACVKETKAMCIGAGYTSEEIKKHPNMPKNRLAHDPESDAVYIAECYAHYLNLFDEKMRKKSEMRMMIKRCVMIGSYVGIALLAGVSSRMMGIF